MKLQNNPSKAQEIEFLKTLAADLPEDCYLKSLFSDRFIGYVEHWVGNDIIPDVMNMVDEAKKDELSAAQREKEANVEKYKYEKLERELQEEFEELKAKTEEAQRIAKSECDIRNRVSAENENLSRRNRELETTLKVMAGLKEETPSTPHAVSV